MPYTVEDYQRDLKNEVMKSMTEDDIAELMKNFGPEKLLKMYRPEERLKGLNTEERLKGLNAEEIKTYLKKLDKKSKQK